MRMFVGSIALAGLLVGGSALAKDDMSFRIPPKTVVDSLPVVVTMEIAVVDAHMLAGTMPCFIWGDGGERECKKEYLVYGDLWKLPVEHAYAAYGEFQVEILLLKPGDDTPVFHIREQVVILRKFRAVSKTIPVKLSHEAETQDRFQLFIDGALQCEVQRKGDTCVTVVKRGPHTFEVKNPAGTVCYTADDQSVVDERILDFAIGMTKSCP